MRSPRHMSASNSRAHLDKPSISLMLKRRPAFCQVRTVFSISCSSAVEADRADVHLLQSALTKFTTGVDVAGEKAAVPLFRCHARFTMMSFFGRIHSHLVFTRSPSEIAYINHIGYVFELLVKYPILKGSLFHQVVARIGAKSDRGTCRFRQQASICSDLRLGHPWVCDAG